MARKTLLLSLAAVFLALPPGASAASVPAADPAALQREIQALALDPGRAVAVKSLKLAAGLATLQLNDGTLLPASPVGGKTIEMVFLGQGRITLEPPNPIEAGQLELFTGQSRLDAEINEAVLVIGVDAAVDAMLRKPAAQPDAATLQKAAALYTSWRTGTERRVLGVEHGILLDALEDPSAAGYFAAWFRGDDPGDFYYVVDPAIAEQVTLGRFVPLDATEKQRRRLLRQLGREQRKGRLIGLELDDLGQWDTWLAASLVGADGKPRPGSPAFEPVKYTLDVAIDPGLRLTGKARIDLQPVLAGSRAVSVRLGDLRVSRVTDAAGADLFHQASAGELTVVLPRAPAAGGAATIVVHYAGNPIAKDFNLYRLVDTQGWHPHVGEVDRAAFDVTFRWPKDLDLIAGGRRTEGGETGSQRWERRVLDHPALGFSFEVGSYRVETIRSGKLDIRFAFGAGSSLTGRGVKEDVIKAVTTSLAFFEETFGPYPYGELTVATASRNYSQSLPGFVTLSDALLNDLGLWNSVFGLEDRRLVIAHEMAHQWWGDHIGWTSYRDQWISEALASYSALFYARVVLGDELSGVDLTSGWQEMVTAPLPDGSPLESVGPIVLGSRLISSRGGNAYQPIVYKKGAVVVDMLARTLGQTVFPKVLGQIAKVSGGRSISTEDLLAMIEQITSVELDAFADQYIYGTGLPEILYNYRIEKKGQGWTVRGTATQATPYRFRYKVVATGNGTFDVVREAARQVDVESSTLVVPVTVAIHDPKEKEEAGRDGANAAVRGNILLQGETTEFAVEVGHEPKKFWLDRDNQVYGLFLDESRHPKLILYQRGLKAAAAGDLAAAEKLYDQALTVREPPPDDGRTVYYKTLQKMHRVFNARVDLSRARLFLDRNDEKAAEAAIDRAQRTLNDADEEVRLLRSRLDIRRGDYDRAFRRLRKGVIATARLDTSEAYVLLAVAARQTGNSEEFNRALRWAKETGADLSALPGA